MERLTKLHAASSQLRSFEVMITDSFTDTVKDVFGRFRDPAPLLTTLSIRFDHDKMVASPVPPDVDDAFSLLFGKRYPRLSSFSQIWRKIGSSEDGIGF